MLLSQFETLVGAIPAGYEDLGYVLCCLFALFLILEFYRLVHIVFSRM